MKAKHLIWMIALLPAIALMGCEGEQGPAGPAGPAGTDGEDGANGMSPSMCMDCHAEPADLQVQLEYAMSGHKEGLYVDYAGGRGSCSRCHSKQGFQRFAAGSEAEDIVDPAAIDCATCHAVHPATFELRLSGAVEMLWDDTYLLDFGDSSNLCANCHQNRRAEPNVAEPGETFEITSTHYGPHHGPQANVLEGVGFAEIAGSESYPASGGPPGSHLGAGGTCVFCHMDTYADGAGGHTWAPMVSSCTGCHAGATDFDINGFQTETQANLDALRDRLIELGVVEWVEEDEAYEPVVGTYPMVQAQAYFNWIGLLEDRSLGVHNPSYVNALLLNSIDAIAPAP